MYIASDDKSIQLHFKYSKIISIIFLHLSNFFKYFQSIMCFSYLMEPNNFQYKFCTSHTNSIYWVCTNSVTPDGQSNLLVALKCQQIAETNELSNLKCFRYAAAIFFACIPASSTYPLELAHLSGAPASNPTTCHHLPPPRNAQRKYTAQVCRAKTSAQLEKKMPRIIQFISTLRTECRTSIKTGD